MLFPCLGAKWKYKTIKKWEKNFRKSFKMKKANSSGMK